MAVVHTVPVDDVVDHELGDDCVCGPAVKRVTTIGGGDGWHIVHHSVDGRERQDLPRPRSWKNVVLG